MHILALIMTFALANDPAHDADVARVKYDAGKKFYQVGEYQKALKYFKDSFLVLEKPAPELLFNIAQCHKQLGDVGEAITFYKRYLSAAPNASNKAEVEARIRELEADKSSVTPAPAMPAPVDPFVQTKHVRLIPAQPAPDVTSKPPQQKSLLPWVAAGATGVVGIAALTSGLLARSRYTDLASTCGKTAAGCADADIEGLKTRALVTNVLIGLTVGGMATTGVLFYLDGKSSGLSVAGVF